MTCRYHRLASPPGDITSSSRRDRWWRPLALGTFALVLLGVAYPLFVLSLLADTDLGIFRPVLDQVLGQRWHWVFLLGTTCLLLGAGLSAWKLWRLESPSAGQLQGAAFLARIVSR